MLASAPLDLAAFYRGPDGALPDHHAMRGGDLADPMRTVGAVRPGGAKVLVLSDSRDRKVPAFAWSAWVAEARRAGLRVSAAAVSGFDPAEPIGAASFHQTAASAMEAALACAAGGEPMSARRGPSAVGELHVGPTLVDRLVRAIEEPPHSSCPATSAAGAAAAGQSAPCPPNASTSAMTYGARAALPGQGATGDEPHPIGAK